MKKIYYNNNGWVCERHPFYYPESEATGNLDVSEEVYSDTLITSEWYAWRVVNDKLVNEEYTELTVEQKIEKQKYLINREIYEKKGYLTQTDYVITKINEAQAYGDEEEVAALKTQYAEILSERKECRTRINELEEQFKALG